MHREKHSTRNRIVPLTAILLAILLGGAALYFHTSSISSVKSPPITFQYRDRTLEELPGVPLNQYQRAGFRTDEDRVSYQWAGLQAKEGIDVSVHQGDIDWPAVAADGIDFAMIRMGYRGYTEGGLNLDSRFSENIQGALNAEIEVGVYFFSQAITPQEAEEEADFVLAALESYPLTYPVVFDWEFITPGKNARTDAMDGTTLTQCALAFCQRIKAAGYVPAIYFNQNLGYLTYDLRQLTEYPFWLAAYDSTPEFHYHFSLWQYTNTGTVMGIQGNVDRNLDFMPFKQTFYE